MKKLYCIQLFFQFTAITTFAQTCGNDSIATSFQFVNQNGELINILTVDSFDLATGVVYTRLQTDTNGISYPAQFSQDFFERKMISYNSNMDTTNFHLLQGNGGGYDSLRKIDFSYDGTFQPLTRIESKWNGTSWDLFATKTWTYDVNGRITGYTETDSTGNVLNKIYTYSGGQGLALTFQKWTGTNWADSIRYLYSYDISGIKDYLLLQRWVDSTSLWMDSISAPYTNTMGWTAELTRTFVDSVTNGIFLFRIDSLGNIVYDSFNNSINFSGYHNTYQYFGKYLLLVNHVEGVFADQQSADYYYDSHGILFRYELDVNYTHYDERYSINYDSLYRPEASTNYTNLSSTYIVNSVTNYGYADQSNISLLYVPMSGYHNSICQGDSLQVHAAVAGGCGPYSYSWSPATGLSSPNVAEPRIYLDDTTTYTITITDSIGNSATASFSAYPIVSVNVIMDTTACPGCPVQLTANYIAGASYQWYRNDTLLPGATFRNYTANITGSYKVRVLTTNCVIFSEPHFISITGINEFDPERFTIFPNPASERVYLKGLSGKFEVIVTDIAGHIVHTPLMNVTTVFLDVRSLPSGVYFITIISDKEFITEPLVVLQGKN